MRPDDRELDDEIRAHLAISVQERIDAGEDPEAARLAALRNSATTMVTNRAHRMTELLGRLAPGATLDAARAELTTVHAGILRQYPDTYAAQANVQVRVTRLRDQIASPARTILLVPRARRASTCCRHCGPSNRIMAGDPARTRSRGRAPEAN